MDSYKSFRKAQLRKCGIGRIVAGGAVGIGILLLGKWCNSPNPVTPPTRVEARVIGVPTPSELPASILPHDGPVNTDAVATELWEIELFRIIARARQTAFLEAHARVPRQEDGILLTGPNLAVQKGAAKRERLTNALLTRALAEIALAHEMTREEIDEICERGEVEGWPIGPATSSANPSSRTDPGSRSPLVSCP